MNTFLKKLWSKPSTESSLPVDATVYRIETESGNFSGKIVEQSGSIIVVELLENEGDRRKDLKISKSAIVNINVVSFSK